MSLDAENQPLQTIEKENVPTKVLEIVTSPDTDTENEILKEQNPLANRGKCSKFRRILGTGSAVMELAIIVVLSLFTLFVSIDRQPGVNVSTAYSLLTKTSVLSFVALFILDLDGGVNRGTMTLAGIGLLVQRFCFSYYPFSGWTTVWWIAAALEAIAMTKIAGLYFRQGGEDEDRAARKLFFLKKVLLGLIIFIIAGLAIRKSNNDDDSDKDYNTDFFFEDEKGHLHRR